MKSKVAAVTAALTAIVSLAIGHAQSRSPADRESIGSGLSGHRPSVSYRTPRPLVSRGSVPQSAAAAQHVPASAAHPLDISTHFSEGAGRLPLWTYSIGASRDGLRYQGAIVGHSPFGRLGTDRIPTFIVPLVVRTHKIATAVDPQTFAFTIVDGDTTVDPTEPNPNCLSAPNTVPAKVVEQSPVFTPTRFVFGGTDVGTTQYLDAFQRASFWGVLGSNADQYHVLLDPVRTTAPVVLDVPSNQGLSMNDPNLFAQWFGTICGPVQAINYLWFDSYLESTVIPALRRDGLDAASLPVFLLYNGYVVSDFTSLGPAAVGYHNFMDPFGAQTYAVVDFDRSGLFLGPRDGFGTEALTHEIGEWGNDPYVFNATPSFGNTGQIVGCQSNLEVGDPLSGTALPGVTMPNGVTYRLQEMAFFSWFYGAPSIAANGWYSNNRTFTTDAGHVCP